MIISKKSYLRKFESMDDIKKICVTYTSTLVPVSSAIRAHRGKVTSSTEKTVKVM